MLQLFLIIIWPFLMPLCYFLQWGWLRRWSPTTPSSWGSVCSLTWSRLAAFHCSRSGPQRGISVSSSRTHQHISHVHYAVYHWLWLMDLECVHVCVYIYLFLSVLKPICTVYVLCLLGPANFFFYLLSSSLVFVPNLISPPFKSSAFHFQCLCSRSQLNALMWN